MTYITSFFASPFFSLVIIVPFSLGLIVLTIVGIVNWYSTIKADWILWIKKNIYHDHAEKEEDAERVFRGITTFFVAMGIFDCDCAFVTHNITKLIH